MRGSITRRGKSSWRIKFDAYRDPVTGKRDTRFVTVRGTKKDAQTELTRILSSLDTGNFVEPTKLTVAVYMRSWVENAAATNITPKTAERYRGLIEHQIVPHLGKLLLQKLRPSNVSAWHTKLLEAGPSDGRPLAARTVGHAHRVLTKALNDAVRQEIVTRNVAAAIPAPKVETDEMETLSVDQVMTVLAALRDTMIYPHVVVLLSTGMRRGEIMGLQWGDIDLDAAKVRIERSIEQTKTHGLRIKPPKTSNGRRLITLPAAAVSVIREHRKQQLETRLALGLGRMPDDAYVFGNIEGAPRDPGYVTLAWKRCIAADKIPKVTLHALRHSHASALIARGTDPVTVSRRLGHGNASTTLRIYAHMFDRSDEAAADIMDSIIKNGD